MIDGCREESDETMSNNDGPITSKHSDLEQDQVRSSDRRKTTTTTRSVIPGDDGARRRRRPRGGHQWQNFGNNIVVVLAIASLLLLLLASLIPGSSGRILFKLFPKSPVFGGYKHDYAGPTTAFKTHRRDAAAYDRRGPYPGTLAEDMGYSSPGYYGQKNLLLYHYYR